MVQSTCEISSNISGKRVPPRNANFQLSQRSSHKGTTGRIFGPLMKTPFFRISSTVDAFWQDPVDCPEATPLKLLVLTPTLAPDSEEEKLVSAIVKACKLPEDQTRIISGNDDAFPPWQHLKKCYTPHAVLNMGILPQMLVINAVFPQLQPIIFGESYWITVGTPAQLLTDRDTRQKLWTDVLKPLFGG